MSENIARYNVILELITQQTGDLQRIKDETTGLQGTFNRAKGAFAGIVAANVANSAIASIQGIISKGVGLAAQFETTSQSFKVLIGDLEQSKQLIADLNTFSIETPFEPAEIQASAKTLLGFGRTAQQVKSDIEVIGNASAATGASLQGLSLVFGQVAGAGRLMGQDALQFINQGIPVYQILAESLGVSVEEVKKLQEQGKITFDILRESFVKASQEGGKFAGALELQSKTFQGLLSTLRGNVDEAFKGIGEVILPILKPLLEQAGSFFNNLIKQIEQNKEQIQQYFNDLISIVVPVVKVIGTVLLQVSQVVIGFVAVLVSIPRILKENQTAFKALGVALIALNGRLVVTKALLIANNIAKVAMYGSLKRAAAGVTLLTTVQKGLNAAFRANPIGIVVAAIALLVAGIDILYRKSETFRQIVGGIVNVIVDLYETAKQFFSDLNDFLNTPIGTNFSNLFSSIRTNLTKGFKETFGALADIVSGDDISGGFAKLGKKILNLMLPFYEPFVNIGKKIVESFKEGFNKAADETVTKGTNRGSLASYQSTVKRLAEERKLREDAEKKRREDARKAAAEAAAEAAKQRKEKLAQEINKTEIEFAEKEKRFREEIKDQQRLKAALELLENEKQIAISKVKQKFTKDSKGNFFSDQDKKEFLELGNNISELEDKLKTLDGFKIKALDLLSLPDLVKVKTETDALRNALTLLNFELQRTSDESLQNRIKFQMKEIDKALKSFTISEVRSPFDFITDLDGEIDLGSLAPDKQVNALLSKFKLVGDRVDFLKNKIKENKEAGNNKTLFLDNEELKKADEQLELITKQLIELGLIAEENEGLFSQMEESLINTFNSGLQTVVDGALSLSDLYIAQLDRMLDAQDERVNKATEIAEKGNVEQLKLEEQRLAELEAKRKKASDRQLILEKAAAQAQIAINTAMTASNMVATLSREGATKGVVGAAVALAVLGGLIATAANLYKPPGFFLGTEEVAKDPQFSKYKVSNGRDGYWARFDGTERIVEGKTNKKLKGIPNKLLPYAVEALERYKVMDYPKLAFDIPGPSNDHKKLDDINTSINELRKSFEGLKINTKLDSSGFTQNIQRRVDKVIRRKRIRG